MTVALWVSGWTDVETAATIDIAAQSERTLVAVVRAKLWGRRRHNSFGVRWGWTGG